MKSFAGGMQTKSKGKTITNFLIGTSYCVFIVLMLIAALLALNSMSSLARKLEQDPGGTATHTAHGAARAGVSAALNHIQCHSYTAEGALPATSHAQGGRFRVLWRKPNLEDSTVRIISFGSCQKSGRVLAETSIDTLAHLEFFCPRQQAKMERYYSSSLERLR